MDNRITPSLLRTMQRVWWLVDSTQLVPKPAL